VPPLPHLPRLPGIPRVPPLPHLPRLPGIAHLPHLPPVPSPSALARMVTGRHRRVWRTQGRAHLEVRVRDAAEAERLAKELVGALADTDGIDWWEVHVPTRRLVVAHPPEGAARVIAEVEAALDRAEAAAGIAGRPFTDDAHPADPEPVVIDLVGIAADVAGTVLGVVGQALRLRPPAVETVVAAAVSVTEGQNPVRRVVEDRIGRPVADLGLGFANALLSGLTQGPVAPMVDLARRVMLFGELTARLGVWDQREADLFARPDGPVVGTPVPSRPVPLPDGPVERYADLAFRGSVVGAGAALVLTRRPDRASSVLQAGLPKAARLGRDGFAAQLSRHLASLGVLVLRPEVLRRLDRVDALVLHRSVFTDPAARAGIDALVELATRHGLGVHAPGAGGARPTEAVVTTDGDTLAVVRDLQARGRVVLLVTAVPGAAAAAADVSIGLHRPGTPVPWDAHLLAGDDPAPAVVVLRAVSEARAVSRESAELAVLGAAASLLLNLGAGRPAALARAPNAVSVAAALALANGVRRAVDVTRHPLPPRPDPTPWHALDGEEVLRRLGTTQAGLHEVDAAARHRPPPPAAPLPVTFARAVAAEAANPLTPILAGGAALSAAVGSLTDAALVSGVVVFDAVVGAVQQVRAERATRELFHRRPSRVEVLRDGQSVTVTTDRLVPGDVVVLRAGQSVPADCRLLEAVDLEVDEAAITGESLPVGKHSEPVLPEVPVAHRSSMLYQGSWVAAGEARAVVVAVGPDTETGRALLATGHRPTGGVEARLRSLPLRVIPAALGSGVGLVAVGLARGVPLRRTVASAVSLAVAAVPEGLPLLSTVAQLGAARRLAARQVLVRNSRAIEALGRVDVVCADKTGTLTLGRVGLRVVSDGVEVLAVDDDGPITDPRVTVVLSAARRATPDGEPERLPHPTDRAVAAAAARCAGLVSAAGSPGWRVVDELPFEPARGYHAAVGRAGGAGWLVVKGAPEVVLDRCRHRAGPEGPEPLDDAGRAALGRHVEGLARRGLRVLAVAESRLPDGDPRLRPGRALSDEDVGELTFVGFLGLADAARPTAAAVVATLRRGGVAVRMVTGDHPSTATAIAAELGLLDGGEVLAGDDLDRLDDRELADRIDEVAVFARVTPAHKVRIVRGLQARGHTVAMTGDGANDAAAIHLADVGIALGRRSTDAAQQAADLVLVDDRLEVIADALVEGRGLWAAVRDAISVLVGGNLGEIGFTLLGALADGTSPLGARQLLLVNLLTDAAPAMAIAVRGPRGDAERLLREGPEASLGEALDRTIAWRAVVTGTSATVAWGAARLLGARPARAGTVALVSLVGVQLGQTLAAGGRDPLVVVTGVSSALVLAGIVSVPGLSHLFGCRPLGPIGWGLALGTAAGGTVIGALAPRVVPALAGPTVAACPDA
jgi:cation-transporting ATPase I